MLYTNEHLQNQFNNVEKLFRKEVPEHKTMPEADNGGYKEMLKAYMDLEPTAFEVLYDDQLYEYKASPQDFHLYGDDSRVDWGEALIKLEAMQ